MDALVSSITGVLMILGLVALGFLLVKGGVFNDDDGRIMN